ncbi:MAG: GC-type dockerin domain-anchored protein [Phycisphaerales bacterium]
MSTSTTRRLIVRTAAALVAAAAGLASPALAQNWHWVATNGSWSQGGNWNPAVPPNAASIVNIGNTGPAVNGTVSIAAAVQMAQLNITDGMALRNESSPMTVAGTTSISGSNTAAGPFGQQVIYPSRLVLDPVAGNSLWTNNLTLSDEARLDCLNEAYVAVGDLASTATAARIGGIGFIGLYGAGTTLNNNGRLVAGGGIGLNFNNSNGGLFDLDGSGGGGVLDLSTTSAAHMRFAGPGLSDSFGGSILFTSGAELEMNLDSPWTANSASEIDVATTSPDAAIIRGAAMTFFGHINIAGDGGSLLLNPAALTIDSPAVVDIAVENYLRTPPSTPVVINGGTFNLGHFASISAGITLQGSATMHGGQFNMTVPDSSTSQLTFAGDTTWDGTVNITGNAAQQGDATVSGPTVINARRFVMSYAGNTEWAINSGLTVNAHAIGWISSDTAATFNIGGGLLPRLTVNLDTPGDSWTAYGDVNLAGSGSIFVTRIAGSKMRTIGDFTLPGGKAQVAADTDFVTGTLNIGSTATLRMLGRTVVGGPMEVTGQGVLRNGPAGHLTLSNGCELGQVGVENEGRLDVAHTAIVGTVSLDRITSLPGSTLAIDVGGQVAGSQHDLMLVSGGGAILDGSLEVRMPVLPGPPFAPAVGDEFTFLTALGTVSGTFTNTPVTHFDGATYHWSVIYTPHAVSLRLDAINRDPCNAADVAGLGGVAGSDGQLTADDVVAFLAAFFANNLAIADIAGLGGSPGADGAITPDDLVYFLAAFFSPCGH